MLSFIQIALLISTLLPLITAQSYCNATSKCPSTAPCCSEYGFCGTGSYCLGGCEPIYSYQTSSCLPNPVCQDHTSTFTDLSMIQTNGSLYNGNASAYDWVVNSGSVVQGDDGMRLILTEDNGGTKISSTRYIHYGTIDYVIKTSKWNGVVTAAITMSDVKDEIDWEFPGSNTTDAQTNYWYLGVANYSATEGQTLAVDSDTSDNFHTFTLDWQEDYLNWSIDGTVVRTVLKSDTWGSDGTAHYPSTPSRVQLSIWPAGISSSAQGTIDWAGGMIDWTNSDYTSNGYFWNTVQSVKITCAQDSNQTSGTTGWAYSDSVDVPAVLDTNSSTMLNGESRIMSSPSMGMVGIAMVSLIVISGICLSLL